jgi:hypothetical protein
MLVLKLPVNVTFADEGDRYLERSERPHMARTTTSSIVTCDVCFRVEAKFASMADIEASAVRQLGGRNPTVRNREPYG